MDQKGLNPFSDQIRQLANEQGSSFEDAAYRAYYGLSTMPTQLGQMGGSGDLANLNRANQALFAEANKPAIESLQASVPETKAAYGVAEQKIQSGIEPLKARYQSLLDELTRRQGVEEQQGGLALTREYGKRGVPVSSGMFDQNLIQNMTPIRQFYAGQSKDVGLGRESDLLAIANQLAQLPISQATDLRSIQNAIAAIQSGGSKDAITQAFNQYQFAQNLEQQRKEMENNLSIAKLNLPSESDRALKNAQTAYYASQAGIPFVA